MIAGFNIKTIDDVEIKNKTILVRVDFDVSLHHNFTIADDTRMKKTLPTLKYLLEKNNKLILVSKLNRPKTRDPKHSLKVAAEKLHEYLPNYKIVLVDDFLKDDSLIINQRPNEIVLLENIRYYPEEKQNDADFAKKLASYADIFVFDAFAMAHRREASVIGIPQFIPAYAGFLLKKEIEMLSQITKDPQRPVTAIIGGSKISTKINLINKLMHLSNYILVGGGLANTFLKAKGVNIGKSLYEEKSLDNAKDFLKQFETNNCKLMLPDDAVCGDPKNSKETVGVYKIENIPSDSWILDIGPETQAKYGACIHQAKTIVWNGPVGLFENQQYRHGTDYIYYAITHTDNAVTIVGGGDTLAAISKKEYLDKITHISTGGGAMLEFIEKGTLPGLEALRLR